MIRGEQPEAFAEREFILATVVCIKLAPFPGRVLVRNSCADCPACSSAASAPGVATIWPKGNSCTVCDIVIPPQCDGVAVTVGLIDAPTFKAY